MNCDLIEQYARGGEKLRLAIKGLTQKDLVAFPIPGKWSILQVVIHLQDSDLIASDRMKRVIAEDNPTLIGFDESMFVANLAYHEQSAEDAVTLFDLNRKQFARVLRTLPDSVWTRVGTHNERGVLTLGHLLQTYTNHLEHHLKFIHEKRKAMGKEVW
jgi:hypothetical protein